MRRYLIFALFAAIGVLTPANAYSKSAKEVFAEVSGGIVVVIAMNSRGKEIGQGSGVVVGTNEVATNCHVVSGAQRIAVRQAADTRGRETYRMEAKPTTQNKTRDLCILFVDELSLPPAASPVPLGTARDVVIGEEVYAIGAPHGLELSLSRGVVSQLRGEGGKRAAPIIQTDAAISPGSSGGGLFNENGELIGITTFKASGTRTEGLSFAVPVEWVAELSASVEVRPSIEQQRIARLEHRLQEQELFLAEVQSLHLAAKDSLAASEAELRENRDLVMRQRNQILLLNQRIAALREHFARIKKTAQVTERDSPEKDLTATGAEPETLFDELSALFLATQASLAQSEDETAAVRAELSALRDTTAELEARLSDEQERTVLAQRKLEEREIRLAEVQALHLAAQSSLDANEAALTENRQLSARQRDQIAVLNQQIDALRAQLGRVEQALQTSERKTQEQDVTIANLGQRLKMVLAAKVEKLAAKVEELAAYRSEFFGRLREVLSAAGYGEFQPLDAREDEIAHRRNRRIELKLTRR